MYYVITYFIHSKRYKHDKNIFAPTQYGITQMCSSNEFLYVYSFIKMRIYHTHLGYMNL